MEEKRDFAEMIGVTLSYVYNLIDETVPFSTRGTTIERIATVMNIEPEEFSEYRIPQEPILIEETFEGEINDKIEGENGFGYDPIFYFPPCQKTSAQMSLEEKNQYSHRAKALKKLYGI